jgi:hypothetical protein
MNLTEMLTAQGRRFSWQTTPGRVSHQGLIILYQEVCRQI